jgi:4-amino-4-deoxy-L-arabinose transferase-like glycosyltransferase
MDNSLTVPDGSGTSFQAAGPQQNGRGGVLMGIWSKAYANPYLLFLPFLVFFIGYIVLKNNNAFESDEERYYIFAQHLLKGYYSDPAPNVNLWNGPGYPMFLMPFVALKLPLVVIPLMNAFFHYLSIVFLFKSLIRFTARRTALLVTLFWAFYYNAYAELPYILTESITAFLVSAIGLCIIVGFKEKSKKHIYGAGLLFGYLVLVKIIFSNVLMALTLGALVLFLINRKSPSYKNAILVAVIAMLVNLPYLLYTWNLTGKPLYWGTSGGMSLYWMSTPYDKEYGEWHNSTISLYDANETTDSTIMFNERQLQANHRADYNEIYQYKGVAQDDAFKKKAIENIKKNPSKFLKNVVANAGRLLFNFPYSYTYESYTSLLRVSINGILLTMMLLSALLTLLNWRRTDFPIRMILLISLLYLGGSLLVSVYARMFYIILPWILIWVGYMLDRSLKIKLRFN